VIVSLLSGKRENRERVDLAVGEGDVVVVDCGGEPVGKCLGRCKGRGLCC